MSSARQQVIYMSDNLLQIKLLFQTGFDEAELKSYTSVIHANAYQTIKVCYTRKGVSFFFLLRCSDDYVGSFDYGVVCCSNEGVFADILSQ